MDLKNSVKKSDSYSDVSCHYKNIFIYKYEYLDVLFGRKAGYQTISLLILFFY